MANTLGMAAQLGGNALRFGCYLGVNRIADRIARRRKARPAYRPERPVPTEREILADLAALLLADAQAVRDGIFPATTSEARETLRDLARIRAMIADLPSALSRLTERDAGTAREVDPTGALPDYYVQDFHFQTGGYLTDESARLYDVQVDTLFYGSANAMRRTALRPLSDYMAGKDQRRVALLDVACGTGRLLRDIRLAYPALGLTGLDLSKAYLGEAAEHLRGLRAATWLAANAEEIPLPSASQDVVTTVFLYHELPPDVRVRVTAEMARVLKPGGLLIFIDSLQIGDKPNWDGLLEAFPVRFHEPYYRHYVIDDLETHFRAAGLAPVSTTNVFLSKLMVRRKV
jgi:ubiquinone/menaquinone biosynthesis C-methylase UbiE